MATISLLPASLALVHIPRSRLPQLSHPILNQILLPTPTFLNITCNELELSIFAEQAALQDFEAIARKDRRKMKLDPVEITFERWSVLQIDSHNDTMSTHFFLALVCPMRLTTLFPQVIPVLVLVSFLLL